MTTPTREIRPLSRPPRASVTPPGSKSLTNRALILASLAEQPSTITGALRADDTEAMVDALAALGVDVSANWAIGELHVNPGSTLAPGETPLVTTRLSGTTARFIIPAIAALGLHATVDGAEQLRNRPIAPLVDALRSLGAKIDYLNRDGYLPLRVDGAPLTGGEVVVDAGYSSQFLSALLLSAATMPGGLAVTVADTLVAEPFVALTIETLRAFGVHTDRSGAHSYVIAQQPVRGTTYHVEPDATAASYFFGAAMITGGAVTVEGLGRSSAQGDMAFVDVLEQMGATVTRDATATTVVGGPISGIDVDLGRIPDTALTLAAVAAFGDGPTRIRGVEYIRGHETDRITAAVTELRRLGCGATETEDGFIIEPGPIQPAAIATYGDHRMAMSFALVGLRASGIVIEDPAVVAKTYPEFFTDLELLREDAH